MYNLRKRKTAEDKARTQAEPEVLKQKRTSTGKRPREKDYDQDNYQEGQPVEAPLPKPKHKPKSEYQQARINRAKHQRMYLIDVFESASDNWHFVVQGAQHSGSYYNVAINRSLGCTCPDFYRQRKPCKHIYFIVCQVAQFDELLDRMPNKLNMTLTNLILLSGMLRVRLGARLKPKEKPAEEKEEKKEEVSLGDDKDCAICFEELEVTEDLKQCKQCKKFFHDACLKAWLIKNKTCPLCRFDLSTDPAVHPTGADSAALDKEGLDASHPLFHLSRVNLIAADPPAS